MDRNIHGGKVPHSAFVELKQNIIYTWEKSHNIRFKKVNLLTESPIQVFKTKGTALKYKILVK